MRERLRLPPMKTLRHFEAAGRHSSFTRAADELDVTQAAVSKQIRVLEEHLGVALFTRTGRSVALTAAGSELHRAVGGGLARIAEACEKVSARETPARLSLAMRLAFASQFVAPRLGRLKALLPDVDISIVTTEGNPGALVDSVDLAVALGAAPHPELEADFLFSEEVFPVCSPGYLAEHPELRTVEDIPGQTLLHLDGASWRELGWAPIDWSTLLAALGCEVEITREDLRFDDHELLMRAATSGLGIAVAWAHLARDLLEQGLLVRPVPDSYRIDRNHYLLSHRRQAHDPAIGALREWLVGETACLREAPPGG